MNKPTYPQAQAKLTVIFDDNPDRPIEVILSGTAEGIERLCHLHHSEDGLRVVGVELIDQPVEADHSAVAPPTQPKTLPSDLAEALATLSACFDHLGDVDLQPIRDAVRGVEDNIRNIKWNKQ
jgi:hypothetical protein